MNNWLIVVDVQNDFVTGPFGSPEAQKAVENIKKKIMEVEDNGGTDYWFIFYTRDTHRIGEQNVEANRFPRHCIRESPGWCLCDGLHDYGSPSCKYIYEYVVNKGNFIYGWENETVGGKTPDEIEIVGLVTDICVISNALYLRYLFPKIKITVDASCCAGTSPELHRAALKVMKSCCIDVVNEDMYN